ncbi:YceI family protein [Albimonas sp. CAU 1670]|uniref:YceI family protein n=1 Tax=Albimonas sp. CAU 1670 TaxID=3032599 RepID=UPI0023DC95AA|nr:YceI family protein [Albimonas sp. CAU 1670]MDF2234565.1 YceI family protein [Albimonas sp. CAU 1670]
MGRIPSRATRRPRSRGLRAAQGLALLAAAWLAPAPPAAAGDWTVDPEASRLEVVIDVGGKRMAGAFATWSAEIAFDPETPDACRVRVVVDVASLSFPDGMATGAAAEPQWLAAAAHPEAIFEGEGFQRDAPGAWTVHGDLTLKGQSRPLDLSVAIVTEGDVARAEVSAELIRTDWKVGAPGEAMVDAAVTIHATVTAARAD